ncbi:unnamed protein product [Zymoseptoria tritici ST99CH_1E4]|uniref:tRNA (adenine(58)-N(1))-methyltransferase catalytic subunit TRM61 n=1 Tax=Zymoseptoria tritici ST99CH_1E4 TaxID=1276532 RepID=A0A2H1FM74_ZYMTR|nr:unnamed protein product [Zymoseptoria tritici ST99CH_1E4]
MRLLLLDSRRQATSGLLRVPARRWIGDKPYVADDIVLLRQKLDRWAPPILTRPLKPGRRIEGHRGVIQHDDIIGKSVRDVVEARTVKSNKAPTEYRIHNVTLEDYVLLSRRLVTPIYPPDANLIVNILDLHPEASIESLEKPKLEILEAGTGHGALTLHLSRAIHAANSGSRTQNDESEDDAKNRRRAIIHSIDVSSKFSDYAQTVVAGFRRGMYSRNVDFHVGGVSDWVKTAQEARGVKTFLSHAFLDLPSADAHLETVSEALDTDGTLIAFNPSITQIIECATKVKNQGIPLDLDRVVELGVNGGTGGREWDIRFVRPRAMLKLEAERALAEKENKDVGGNDAGVEIEASESGAVGSDRPYHMVCRPKVGDSISGGGFLGIWKKRRDMRRRKEAE